MRTITDFDHDWIAHPDGVRDGQDDESKMLSDNRQHIKVLAEWDEPGLSYKYHMMAVIQLKRKYYVLTTYGCSCPSPTETWSIDFGPAKRADLIKWLTIGCSPYDSPGCQELLKQLQEG